MATQRMAMSNRARPGRRSPKKTTDHRTLSTSCAPNRPNSDRTSVASRVNQTRQAAKAIIRYSTDHTGPKSRAGGFQAGLRSPGYHVRTDPTVALTPTAAAIRQISTNTMRPATSVKTPSGINGQRLKRPRELRRREDVGRRLPPLLDGLAARLMQQRGQGVRRLSSGRRDHDDLPLAQRLRIALANIFRDDPAGEQVPEAITKATPALSW